MTLTELFTNIANAIRIKTGNTEPIIAEDFPSAIEAIDVGENLDEEIATQEEKITSQDELIASIITALENKAAPSGGVTVPDLVSFTWESVNTNSFGDGVIYKIRLTYLTVDENNTLTTVVTSYDTSGSINVVPNTFIYVESEEIETPEGTWGEGFYYPNISDANGQPPFVSSGGADRSMCVFDISYLGNHIAFNVS